ncbi:MAG: hypothetical protein AAFS11_08985, partial [Planctomycetota bacterium]
MTEFQRRNRRSRCASPLIVGLALAASVSASHTHAQNLAMRVVAEIGEVTPDGWVLRQPIFSSVPPIRVTKAGLTAFAFDAVRADGADSVEGVFLASPFDRARRVLGRNFLVIPPDTVYEARHPRFWDYQFDGDGGLVARAALTPPGGFRQPERVLRITGGQ